MHGPWHAFIAGTADAKVMGQYQQDVAQAIRQAAWDDIAGMMLIRAAIGGAAGSPASDDTNVPGRVHSAVYDGPERRAHPR